MDRDIVAAYQQVDSAGMEVEGKAETLSKPIERSAGGEAEKVQGIPVQGQAAGIPGETGTAATGVKRTDGKTVVERHPVFGAQQDLERHHLQLFALAAGYILEAQQAGQLRHGVIDFRFPVLLSGMAAFFRRPGIGRFRRVSADFTVPADGSEVQHGSGQRQVRKDVPTGAQVDGGPVTGRTVLFASKVQ